MRRELKLATLTEASGECERLLELGYTKSGNWSLAQICCHLRLTIERNIDGYPKWMTILGYPLRFFLRRLLLPRLLRGNSPTGIRTAGIFVPPDGLDDKEEFELLKKCVERFSKIDLPLHAHPGFGHMSHEEFDRFHAAHAAHHLSFLKGIDESA